MLVTAFLASSVLPMMPWKVAMKVLINPVPAVLSQVTAACPVFIASRWSCAPPPRFDLMRAIHQPRVPESSPLDGRRCLAVTVH
jgi:hypothetical protein